MRSHRPLGSPPSAQQMAEPVMSCSPLLCSAELQQLISRQAEVRPAKQCVIARASQHHAFRQQFHRSEEHTSELQSLMRISYAVFCLKNKNITKTRIITTTTV